MNRPAATALLAALMIGSATSVGCARSRPAPPAPLIWIVVDTLRADHLEWYGYGRATAPQLRPLVDQGVLFERAYTTTPETSPAIASMLTGLHPYRHGVEHLYMRLPNRAPTAATLLAQAGYATAAFVSSFVMIRDFSHFDRGFQTYDDFVTEREAYRENYERKAAGTLAVARAWIDRHRDQPFFCFIHLIDPHGPYTPPGEFAHRFHSATTAPVPAAAIPAYQRIPGVLDANRYRDLYDGEIAYAAHETGAFLEYLRAAGLFDRSLIVFNADHGEQMGEHGRRFVHGDDLFEENVHVPLIIKPPAGMAAARGSRVTQPVSVVDLLPTVLAALGQPRPATLQGRSLLPLVAGIPGDGAGVFMELHNDPPLYAESRAGRKTFLSAASEPTPAGLVRVPASVFVANRSGLQCDLASDPGEHHPRPAPLPDSAELGAWSRAAAAWRRDFPFEVNSMAYELRGDFIRHRPHPPLPADEDARRLRSLGYL
jgi:arylsulfatase A-like enzyme